MVELKGHEEPKGFQRPLGAKHGAGKNRTSITAVLEIADNADELLVDLALDPQTSGGLLAAVTAEAAETIVRRLPGAAIVGRVVDGKGGAVRLL